MKFVYTTCANKVDAVKISEGAINAKLAVCVDNWEVDSIYPWKGKIENTHQVMLMFTTDELHSEKLKDYIKSNHNYETPLIAESNITVNDDYKNWADNEFG